MNIVDRIEKLLLHRKIKSRSMRSSLAKTCGISHQAVSQWFSGETGNIKNENLAAIAETYGSTVDWLLTGKGEMTRDLGSTASESNVISADFSKKARDGEIDIPHYDVRAAMGAGQVLPSDYIETIRHVTVSLEFLRAQGVSYSQHSNLAMITGFGESMNRTFTSGDPLIIDKGVTSVVTDGVYLFTLSGALFVKRLQILPNGIRVISDNEAFPPYEITGNDTKNLVVHARVLLAWRSQRL